MVEYTYDEAFELLEKQLEQTHLKIAEITEDLDHLKANSITVEVSMARLFNHNIKLKKIASDAAAAKGL
jgi:prefoldin subunit 5